MFRRPLLLALSLAALIPASVTFAQDAAPSQQIMLELNGASDTPEGACQLTMVTTNRLDKGLTRAAWQVAVFDDQGVVQALPVLDFGALPVGKTKVAVFALPERTCAKIGRIVVNDVAECSAEGGDDLRSQCLTGLATQSRATIDFGI